VELKTEPYFTDDWFSAPQKLDGSTGAHRFVWDLRYPRPPSLGYDYSIAAVYGKGGAILPQGPLVLPGTYTVKLTAGGKTVSAPLQVALDPRVPAGPAKQALPAQLALEQQMTGALAKSFGAHETVAKLHADLAALKPGLASDPELQKQVDELAAKAEQLADKAPQHKSLNAINQSIAGLLVEVDDGDRAPPAQYREAFTGYVKSLDDALRSWQALRDQDLARLNTALAAKGHEAIKVAAP